MRAADRHRRAAAAWLVATALAVGGCGGGAAEDAVGETAARLGELRSGELDLSVRASPLGKPLERGAGFSVRGPFSLGGGGRLPVADVKYTRVSGSERGSATLISTGREAFVRSEAGTYELGAAAERELSRAAGRPGGSSGLERLGIDRWVVEPEIADAGGGVERVTAGLDVVRAANAMLDATGRGARIQGVEARRLERAVRSSRLVLETGAEDRLLRRLTVEVELGADVPPAIRSGLGPLGGARFALDLEVTDPNQAVRVSAPKDAQPPIQP